MNPETIDANYRNLIGLLRTPFDPRGLEKEQLQKKRSSGKRTIHTYAQLLGSNQETIESNVQYLWSHGMDYQDGILLGTTPAKKREKIAFLLREVFDYKGLKIPEEKTEAIHEAYKLVSGKTRLLKDSIKTLEGKKGRLREQYAVNRVA